MRVHDERVFARCLRDGTIGLGDAYVEGWWEAAALDEFFCRLIAARVDERVLNLRRGLASVQAALLNLQTRYLSRRVAERHYDLGNELYDAMLDRRMIYTCAYWADAATLDEAQEAKLDLVCRKLGLAPGMRVLDIGCGWGGLAEFAARRYGASVVGVTISEEQATLARERCAGLPVDIRLQDYRDVDGRFDRIVSLGMFEHVGRKNYREYMQTARRLLAPDGLFLLHTIGRNNHGAGIDPWVTRYIFPNSEIPSLRRVADAVHRLFVVEDLHNFGADYARTLLAWRDNFQRAWPAFAARMPSDFQRRWHYYLSMFAGVFRARGLQLWQFVLSPNGVAGGYRRPA
jgi:cyclopropane-fatty-acyl-phospholipid synthase